MEDEQFTERLKVLPLTILPFLDKSAADTVKSKLLIVYPQFRLSTLQKYLLLRYYLQRCNMHPIFEYLSNVILGVPSSNNNDEMFFPKELKINEMLHFPDIDSDYSSFVFHYRQHFTFLHQKWMRFTEPLTPLKIVSCVFSLPKIEMIPELPQHALINKYAFPYDSDGFLITLNSSFEKYQQISTSSADVDKTLSSDANEKNLPPKKRKSIIRKSELEELQRVRERLNSLTSLDRVKRKTRKQVKNSSLHSTITRYGRLVKPIQVAL